MRISDWSSDVCSSDLGEAYVFMDVEDYDQLTVPATVVGNASNFLLENQQVQIALNNGNPLYVELPASVVLEITYTEPGLQGDRSSAGTKRSEEHTSELQSLMRISYAVFCLKKKKHNMHT